MESKLAQVANELFRKTGLDWALRKAELEDLRGKLLSGTLGSFGVKIGTVLLSFAANLVLARVLGASTYGIYAYALAWMNLIAVPATFGMDNVLVRDVSAYRTREQWRHLSGLLWWSNGAALLFSLLLAGAAAIAVAMFMESPVQRTALWIALAALPVAALTRLRKGALRGLQHVVVGQLPEQIIRPVLLMALLGGTYAILRQPIAAPLAVAFYVCASGIAFAVGAWMLRARLPNSVTKAASTFETKAWMRSALPFMLIGGMKVLNKRTDIVMMGILSTNQEVGIYKIASRGGTLVVMLFYAFSTAVAPRISELYASGEIEKLQRIAVKGARTVFALTIPIAGGLVLLGDWFLLLFGREFTAGYLVLVILSFGQLSNLVAGVVGILLNMTGHERAVATGMGISAALNIALNAALIPLMGMEGAATATAISQVIWNGLLVFWSYRQFGFAPSAFSSFVEKS